MGSTLAPANRPRRGNGPALCPTIAAPPVYMDSAQHTRTMAAYCAAEQSSHVGHFHLSLTHTDSVASAVVIAEAR